MDTLQAIVLGIVQGVTEFLPISSTGHLRVVPAFLGWDDPGAAFTAVTQLGTMAAVLIYFRSDLARILVAWLRGLRDPAARRAPDSLMGWWIVLGTVPIALFGFAFRDLISSSARSLYVIGTTLVVVGVVMAVAERVGRKLRPMESIGPRDGLVIGLAQACALIPGVSRSGATITAGLFLGLERAAAARYSFLLSVPAIVLAGVFELRNIGEDGGAPLGPTLIATALAFVTGYLSIAFLLRFLATHTVDLFVVYRIALGLLVLVLAASGTIS